MTEPQKPKRKYNRKIKPPKPENVEQERVLRLMVEIPYFGKADQGVHLEETVRQELNLQFGSKVTTTLIDVPPVKEAKPIKAAVKKAAKK